MGGVSDKFNSAPDPISGLANGGFDSRATEIFDALWDLATSQGILDIESVQTGDPVGFTGELIYKFLGRQVCRALQRRMATTPPKDLRCRVKRCETLSIGRPLHAMRCETCAIRLARRSLLIFRKPVRIGRGDPTGLRLRSLCQFRFRFRLPII